jgi:4-alpha-glucanotransferase
MWAVFLLQDFLSMDASLRRENPHEERINNPADPDHYWNYRVHLSLESLMTAKAFNQDLVQLIHDAGRC